MKALLFAFVGFALFAGTDGLQCYSCRRGKCLKTHQIVDMTTMECKDGCMSWFMEESGETERSCLPKWFEDKCGTRWLFRGKIPVHMSCCYQDLCNIDQPAPLEKLTKPGELQPLHTEPDPAPSKVQPPNPGLAAEEPPGHLLGLALRSADDPDSRSVREYRTGNYHYTKDGHDVYSIDADAKDNGTSKLRVSFSLLLLVLATLLLTVVN